MYTGIRKPYCSLGTPIFLFSSRLVIFDVIYHLPRLWLYPPSICIQSACLGVQLLVTWNIFHLLVNMVQFSCCYSLGTIGQCKSNMQTLFYLFPCVRHFLLFMGGSNIKKVIIDMPRYVFQLLTYFLGVHIPLFAVMLLVTKIQPYVHQTEELGTLSYPYWFSNFPTLFRFSTKPNMQWAFQQLTHPIHDSFLLSFIAF